MILLQSFQPMAAQLSSESCAAIGWEAYNRIQSHQQQSIIVFIIARLSTSIMVIHAGFVLYYFPEQKTSGRQTPTSSIFQWHIHHYVLPYPFVLINIL